MVSLQNGLADKIDKSRKQIKERKNRSKKIRGVKKNAGECWFCIAHCHNMLAALYFHFLV